MCVMFAAQLLGGNVAPMGVNAPARVGEASANAHAAAVNTPSRLGPHPITTSIVLLGSPAVKRKTRYI